MRAILKRKSVWALVALVLAGPFLACILLKAPWASRITRANLEQVHEGMTKQEVDAILGRPAAPGMAIQLDDLLDGKPWKSIMYRYEEPESFYDKDDYGFIVVNFDLEGKVEWAQWCRGPQLRLEIERSLTQRIRDGFRCALYRMGLDR
jgi:SmpA / OmlA family